MSASGKEQSVRFCVVGTLCASFLLTTISIGLLGFSYYKLQEFEEKFVSKDIHNKELESLRLKHADDMNALQEMIASFKESLRVKEATETSPMNGLMSRIRKKRVIRLTLDELLSLRGPPGKDGRDGQDGQDGQDGKNGVNGKSGVNYVRWGRQDCPINSSIILQGFAAGTYLVLEGGAAEYICLSEDPQYQKQINIDHKWKTPLSAVEFDDARESAFGQNLHNQNLGCAICEATTKAQQLMLPARWSCPAEWSMEYNGYLMAAPGYEIGKNSARKTTQFICVDQRSQPRPGLGSNGAGASVGFVVADCSTDPHRSLHYCPPYIHNMALSCVVCTK